MDKILLPYQREALQGIKNHKYSVLLWCRQAGKSFLLALFALERAVAINGHTVIVISPSERQSKEFMEKVRLHISAIKALQIEFFEDVVANVLEAKFPNGSRIIAVPSKPETVRGFSGDCIMDEASFFDRGHEVYQAVFPTITRRPDYKLVAISTPRSKKDIFYYLWHSAETDPLWFRMKLDIYEAKNKGLAVNIEELRRGIKSERAWRTEYLCEFLDEEEVLLPYETITSCEEDTRVDDLRALTGEIYVGIDIGRRGDLTAIAICEKLGSMIYLRKIETLRGVPFSEQAKIIDHIAAYATRVAIDETGLGMQLSEELEQRWGTVKIKRVYFTARVKEELAERLKIKFQDRTIRIYSDNDLREELHSIRRVVSDSGNIRYEASSEEGHADRAWALALAVYALATEQPSFYVPPLFTGVRRQLQYGIQAVA
ncbi:terminase large subunit domain-containing protein [Thermodesulfovibrio yellowstonii]|uniref:terminase large subunit domain-containing protein n=1 Tax=Thermodesulfovibrio yellowstonii TaxID=28262 RepID=UPI0024B3268C|nr:terminase family protein [Thermodesulfovibrio yellowstonii]MDI6865778.1 terminase family protein [Thermodesulfovibrio yellowstonii]